MSFIEDLADNQANYYEATSLLRLALNIHTFLLHCLLKHADYLPFWIQVLGTIFGIFIVDRFGRREILIFSSILTFLAELALGIIFAFSVDENTVELPHRPALASIILVIPTKLSVDSLHSLLAQRPVVSYYCG